MLKTSRNFELDQYLPGKRQPTQVRITPVKGKCILVSGHDLADLGEPLKQTEGKGINVYTHGEMLPCHAYPELKTYPHSSGNSSHPASRLLSRRRLGERVRTSVP